MMLNLSVRLFGYLVVGLVSMLAACGRLSPNGGSRAEQVIPEEIGPALPQGTIVEAGEDSGTVLYRYEDFLLEGTTGMAFCVIKNGKPDPPGALSTCRDTLYADSSLILLCHLGMLKYEGLYKRYEQQYHPAEFPADAIYHDRLAAPDFSTDPDARYFKTRTIDGCRKEGVNFGGHYTIIEIGCGHACMMMTMVDRIDGRVYFTDIPFDTLDGHHGLAFNQISYLLEVNTAAINRIPGYSVVYWRKPATYLWNEKRKRFELLQTLK